MVAKKSESMQPEMLLVTAKCCVCPSSQVEVGSAAEGGRCFLLDCTETILTMSLQPVQPEMLLVISTVLSGCL